MQELFRKYLDNKCSPEEVKELLGYFNIPENELLLRNLITESLENEDDKGIDEWQSITDETYTRIKERLQRGKVMPFFKKTWFRVAAAAVLVIGGFAVYQSVSSYKVGKQEITNKNVAPTEIGPASSKATLILADGSEIILENAANGVLTQQGSTEVVKLENGQVSYNILSGKPTEALYNNITTPRGGQYQLTLSDGSKIWLNAGSSIRFPVAFAGTERRIAITGEAYMEVAKNAAMPFVVNVADKGEVKVLGTHFNVNSYNDEATINTTLLEGSVKVTGLATRESVVIAPGEQAQLDKNGSISLNKKAAIQQAIAWKNGVFNFTNASLENVMRQLSRWYDIDILFEGPVPQRQFNGEMPRSMNLAQVLKLLEKNNVYCKVNEGKLVVLK